MKFLVRKSAIVNPRKPDYDIIRKLESELLGRDMRFEVRYNDMLIRDYEERKANGNWSTRNTMLELGYLSEELYNGPQKFKILISLAAHRNAYIDERMRDPKNRKRHDELRARMSKGRQWRRP
jgi:hypothetical protein